MKLIDILLIGIVLVVFSLTMRKIIKDKKAGKSCGGCAGCSMAHKCGEREHI